jgi:hypothetical protein
MLISAGVKETMNLLRRDGTHIVIRQIPFLLLIIGGLFSLPLLGYSLFHIFGGTPAEGKYFTLFFGLLILWLFLEFVATRERIDIDLNKQVLTRTVKGVFRRSQLVINLPDIESIGVELKTDSTGTRRIKRQYVYLYGKSGPHLMNSPEKVYLNHSKLGKIISEATGLSLQKRDADNQP